MSTSRDLLSRWLVPVECELLIGDQESHVWRLSLTSSPSNVRRMAELLDPTECSRAGRFRFEKDRRQYILTRGVLRMLLGRYLRRDPSGLNISYSSRGKPFIAGSENRDDLRFSVSHAGDLALLAFSRGRETGVDIESRQRLKNWKSVAERIFSEREKQELNSLTEMMRTVAFYNGWTRKEAYLKATGEGLVDALSGIEVSISPLAPACLRAIHGDVELASRWSIYALEPAEGYAAALVVEGGNCGVRLWLWDAA
jgi:4'-phosphopantetheinyl transferase